MKLFPIAGALALALAVAACGGPAATTPNQQRAAASNMNVGNGQRTYSGEGNVTAIAGDQVSISHGPIEGLGWPAMTMTFRAEPAQMVEGIAAGDRVAFQFRENDGSHVLTAISQR
jgi:Cu/Ag efflux protein CusF